MIVSWRKWIKSNTHWFLNIRPFIVYFKISIRNCWKYKITANSWYFLILSCQRVSQLEMNGKYVPYRCGNLLENQIRVESIYHDKRLCIHFSSVKLFYLWNWLLQRRKNRDWLCHRELWKNLCRKYHCVSTFEVSRGE